jgi:hypothetical protein
MASVGADVQEPAVTQFEPGVGLRFPTLQFPCP